MHPTWQSDEFKAFKDAVAEHGWAFEYLAISLFSKQAAILIRESGKGQKCVLEEGWKPVTQVQ